MPWLGLLDVSGIQKFIFREPKLALIADASLQLEKMGEDGGLFRKTAKASGATCLIAAGGNAAYRADSREQIVATFRAISRQLLEDGDGLQIVVSIEEYPADQLAQTYPKAMRKLECAKLMQQRGTEFIHTGLDAPLPPGKVLKPAQTRKRVNDFFTEPLDIENLICEAEGEESNLIAVVSVDGIGMGKRLLEWMEASKGLTDEVFIKQYKAWSEFLKKRWQWAWEQTVRRVIETFPHQEDYCLCHPYGTGGVSKRGHKRCLRLKWEKQNEQETEITEKTKIVYLPCRKIFQGGDDMRFVCDARIALSMSEFLVRCLEDKSQLTPEDRANVPELFQTISASVGVAYVEANFPFVRASDIADMVRTNAKKAAVGLQQYMTNKRPPSTLDWWLNRQGAMTRPELLNTGIRPCPFQKVDKGRNVSWNMMNTQLMPGMWDTFSSARNKMKDIMAAAEVGEHAVQMLLALRPLQSENKATFSFVPAGWNVETGFESGESRTFLVEAGELFDLHFPFPPTDGAAGTATKEPE